MQTPKQPYQVLKDLSAQPLPPESEAVTESPPKQYGSFSEAFKTPEGNAAIQAATGKYWDGLVANGSITAKDAGDKKRDLAESNGPVEYPGAMKDARRVWEAGQRAKEAEAVTAEEKANGLGKDDLEK